MAAGRHPRAEDEAAVWWLRAGLRGARRRPAHAAGRSSSRSGLSRTRAASSGRTSARTPGRRRRSSTCSARPTQPLADLPALRRSERRRRHALELVEGEPLLSAQDGPSTNRLWRITDPDAIGPPGGARRPAAADRRRPPPLRDRARLPRGAGHRGERLDAWPSLVNTQGEGLTIFPTHRVVGRAPALDNGFRITPVSGGPDEALAVLDGVDHDHAAFVLYRGGGDASLVEAPDEVRSTRPRSTGSALEDVTYTPERRGGGPGSSTPGRAEAAFLLRPPTIEQVEAVAQAGETMPQKSTYFYPKLSQRPALPPACDRLARGVPRRGRRPARGLRGAARRAPSARRRRRRAWAATTPRPIDEAAERSSSIGSSGSTRTVSRSRSSPRSSASAASATAARAGSSSTRSTARVNAKRGIPFFALSIAVAEGADDGRRHFGYVHDFGIGRGVDGRARARARGSNGEPLARELPEGRDRDPLLRGDDDRATSPTRAAAVVGLAYRLRVMGSLALSLCHLAAGRVDAVCSLKPARVGGHRRRAAARPRVRARDRPARGAAVRGCTARPRRPFPRRRRRVRRRSAPAARRAWLLTPDSRSASAARAGTTPTGATASTRRAAARALARALRDALRHRRGQLDLLPPAAARRRRGWVEQRRTGFVFAVKMSRYVTHIKRLRDLGAGARALLRADRAARRVAEARPGPLAAAAELPARRRPARGGARGAARRAATASSSATPSWFTEPVYELLREHGVALVIGDPRSRRSSTLELTADWTFVRFHHGTRGRRGNYSERELEEWARPDRGWRREADVSPTSTTTGRGSRSRTGCGSEKRLGVWRAAARSKLQAPATGQQVARGARASVIDPELQAARDRARHGARRHARRRRTSP